MGANINVMFQSIWSYLPQLMGALLVLLVGWLVALALAGFVQGILRKTSFGSRIGGWMSGRAGVGRVDVDTGVSRIVYYLVLVLVLVAFFQALGLTLATQPLNNLLQHIFEFVPRLLGALLLAAIAWVVASGLRFVLTSALRATTIDGWVVLGTARENGAGVPISKSLGRQATCST